MDLTPEQTAETEKVFKRLKIFNGIQNQQITAQKLVKKEIDRLNIPDDWNSIEEFAEWYRAAGYPILPPADTRVYVSDVTYSTIAFRKGRFQAEFYMIAPNSTTNPHTHNHASKFIILAGSMEGYYEDPNDFVKIGKRYSPSGKDDVDPDYSVMGVTCHAGDYHGLRTLEHGVVYFNIEMWPEDIVPTSAAIEFDGPSMGPEHEKLMQDLKQKNN